MCSLTIDTSLASVCLLFRPAGFSLHVESMLAHRLHNGHPPRKFPPRHCRKRSNGRKRTASRWPLSSHGDQRSAAENYSDYAVVNMLRPTFTRLAPKAALTVEAARQSLAMHGLRWLATTPATTTRITGTLTCQKSAMVMRPRNNWQMQTLKVRCMATMPEDELKKRMGT